MTKLVRVDPKPRATNAYASNAARWNAIVRRDARADGKFYYSVQTTGVYCRPSCASRQALRQHVAFHDSCRDAELAGFRPCRRCRPDQPPLREQQIAKITNACRLLESADEPLDLATLAQAANMSPFHFHRVFSRLTGVTPKAYAATHRAARVREELSSSPTVTAAVYAAGFNSNGRFYAQSSQILGMTPTQYRKGGRGETIRFVTGSCVLGSILVALSTHGVCAILLGDKPTQVIEELRERFPNAKIQDGGAGLRQQLKQVISFVEAPGTALALPLDLRGTVFQCKVWRALTEIPLGTTTSYSAVASQLGIPSSVRAVARAVASNPIAVVIPCHRVQRQDGSLAGYRWGVERKRTLLRLEAGGRKTDNASV